MGSHQSERLTLDSGENQAVGNPNRIMVKFEGIYKRYGKVVAVEKMDLEISEGSLVTLLGHSGCGKTTLLRMIAGLEEPTAGNIYVKGERINDVPIHRRNLGMIFQNYALFPHKTIFENVAFGLKYAMLPKPRSAAVSPGPLKWCACPAWKAGILPSCQAGSSNASRWRAPS